MSFVKTKELKNRIKRDQVVEKQWLKIFGSSCEVYTNESESRKFITKLALGAISTIFKARKLVPKHCFKRVQIGNTSIDILGPATQANKRSSNYTTLACWLTGVMDAIKRKYLREVMVTIRNIENDEVIEGYHLLFSYEETEYELEFAGTTLNPSPKGTSIKPSTLSILEKCNAFLKSLKPYEKQVYFKMTLRYQEHTPPLYEPPGFKSAATLDVHYKNDSLCDMWGAVGTVHHCLELAGMLNQDKNSTDEILNISDGEPNENDSMWTI